MPLKMSKNFADKANAAQAAGYARSPGDDGSYASAFRSVGETYPIYIKSSVEQISFVVHPSKRAVIDNISKSAAYLQIKPYKNTSLKAFPKKSAHESNWGWSVEFETLSDLTTFLALMK